jgi:group I intron endonuclease
MPQRALCGIYRITSPSGNFYVGSSANVRARLSQHFASIRKGKHHSAPLQRAADKYGAEAMVREVLCECPREHLRELEQLVIDMAAPAYNASPDTRTPLDHLWRQEWFREKTAAAASKTAAALWADPEFRVRKSESSRRVSADVLRRPDVQQLSAASSGAALRELWKTPEHQAKMAAVGSRTMLDHWKDPTFRQKMAASASERGRRGMAAMRSDPENREAIRRNGAAQAHNLKRPEARAKNIAGIRAAVANRVRCVETGQVFDAIADAARAMGIRPQGISAAVRGLSKRAAGFTWEYC